MFPSRRWIPASVALALLALAAAAVMASSAPVPPAPPAAPAPPAPPGPPEVHIWTDGDDGPMAFAGFGDDFNFVGDDGDWGGAVSLFAMGGGMSGMGGGWTRGELADKIKLTEDQRDKIDAIRDKQQRAAIQARADLQVAELDMRNLMKADKPDRSAIDTQIDKMASQRAELRKSQIRTMLDMRDVLTPQQRTALKEEREKRMAAMRDRHGAGGDRHRDMIRVRSHSFDTQ
jgi:Spy/CpxP family protein refolding chaperone